MNATVSMVSPAMAPVAMVFGPFYSYLHFCADCFSKAEFFICDRAKCNVLCSTMATRTEVYVTSYQKLIIYEGLNAPIIVEG
jgi:hypothetical protein